MLNLYNTMSRKIEPFKPHRARSVKMFTCGPSIYRKPHVGNYRSFLWEDVLLRYLEYQGYTVERVINLTDVEDKAIAEAQQEGGTVQDITESIAQQFSKDAELLKIKLPEFIPRSSNTVDQAVHLIKILLARGYAYRHGNDIFYDPLQFKDFGKLFRLDMTRWPKQKRRFRRDTYPGRRWNLGDFILWHGYKDGDSLYWDTEIGRGRPAWNIQDPAIITKHLGYQIDIACGGVDNLYRHHDYNIAVIEAVSGKEFSRYWIHGEHLLVDGKKMSKSRGNIVYPEDLLRDGYDPEQVRFYLIYGHHREELNLTHQQLEKTSQRLNSFRGMFQELAAGAGFAADPGDRGGHWANKLRQEFEQGMNDDLNVRAALDNLHEAMRELVVLRRQGKLTRADANAIRQTVAQIDNVLQLNLR
ncbi:class I tRNA ligase family protein [Desulfoferrobacter suflitae]|uniref:class I tRNA ligase family protein n=1 Tax=Desulfoferrobacter suflitae TaxID=2865782 RepID=UPI0021641296|nr:class I tRNA ligase family protein [Desulfoferrobacter suflitae]MCK8602088.1 class I tRNA ligase family protein [Desulfoferrobacter suflitae]